MSYNTYYGNTQCSTQLVRHDIRNDHFRKQKEQNWRGPTIEQPPHGRSWRIGPWNAWLP